MKILLCELVASCAACLVLLVAVPVFALVFFLTLDEPKRRRA